MNSDRLIKRDDGIEYTTPKHYVPELKAAVYEGFMNTNKTVDELALEHKVGRDVIAAWSKSGGWMERRKAIEAEIMRMSDDKYKMLVMENKVPVLRMHLRISGKLESAIEQVVDDELASPSGKGGAINDMKLKRMAEALAAVTTVSTKALGLADTVIENNAAGGGRVPLVAIGIGPSLPGERTMQPSITIQEVEP